MERRIVLHTTLVALLLTSLNVQSGGIVSEASATFKQYFPDYKALQNIHPIDENLPKEVSTTLFENGYKQIYLEAFSQGLAGDNWSKVPVRQRQCLVDNMVYEAANQGITGLASIAEVTLMRVYDKRYPKSICGVVHERNRSKKTKKMVCQFSWSCEDRTWTPSKKSYLLARDVAKFIINIGMLPIDGIVKGATHYHADYVNPAWAKEMNISAVVKRHIFYKGKKKT